MNVIKDKNGKVIQTSQNLAGIRRYVSNHRISLLSIDSLSEDAGKLTIQFVDGAKYQTTFRCLGVLKGFVERWRNVYGSPLRIDGEDKGTVKRNNEALIYPE